MEIKRDTYLEKLKIRKNNGMIKVITGIRRCGKSFLLFVLFKKYLLENGVDSEHIIEIALDGIENEELRDPKKCYQYIKEAMKDSQNYYLFLDEVQFMPRFEEVLNSLLRISNIDVYVTGSNSKFLSSDIVTEFRGRGDEIRIYPLSFAEFYASFDGDYEDSWEEYMTYGGLPQVARFSIESQKAEYLKNIFSSHPHPIKNIGFSSQARVRKAFLPLNRNQALSARSYGGDPPDFQAFSDEYEKQNALFPLW